MLTGLPPVRGRTENATREPLVEDDLAEHAVNVFVVFLLCSGGMLCVLGQDVAFVFSCAGKRRSALFHTFGQDASQHSAVLSRLLRVSLPKTRRSANQLIAPRNDEHAF